MIFVSSRLLRNARPQDLLKPEPLEPPRERNGPGILNSKLSFLEEPQLPQVLHSTLLNFLLVGE